MLYGFQASTSLFCKRGDFVDMKGNPDADEILALANGLYTQEHKHRIGRDDWTGPSKTTCADGRNTPRPYSRN